MTRSWPPFWSSLGAVRSAAILVMLAAATLVLRAPFLAPRLAHWDAVNYALGLHDFNVAAHQPHPPGSPYFILAGRAALAPIGDDNGALLLISLVASVGAVLAEYALTRLLFGPRAAFLAACVLITQPVFWGYGTTASAWTVLACSSICIGLVSLLLLRGRRQLLLGSAVLIGIVSGFRLDAAAFLAPLWLWALGTAEHGFRRRAAAVCLAAICLLAWLVPVVASAGGITAWSERLVALLPSTDASASAVARQLAANTAISFGMLAFTIGPPLALGGVVDRHRAAYWLQTTLNSKTRMFWALWILPAFSFLWLVDKTEPGHDLVFTGALVALGAGLVAHCALSRARLALCGAVVLGVQAGVFLFAAPLSGRPLAWTVNSMLLNVTAPGLREQQSSLDSTLRTIRTQFDPDQTVVLTLIGQDPYRFMMYYLPEYTVVRLDPETRTELTARDRHQGNWTAVGDCLPVGSAVSHIVWVLSSSGEPGAVPQEAMLMSDPREPGPFQIWTVEPTSAAADYLGFAIGGPPCHAGGSTRAADG